MFTICLEGPILGGYILQYPLVVEGSPNVEVVVVPEEVVPLIHVHPRDLVGYDLIQEIFLWPCNNNLTVPWWYLSTKYTSAIVRIASIGMGLV